jgi:hypothetical protein
MSKSGHTVQRKPAPGSIEIPLARIRRNPYQPRRRVEQEALEQLAASIAEHGVIQPVLVTETFDGYQLVAGERRVRAAQMAGLDRIPAIVRQLAEHDQLQLALVEMQRRVQSRVPLPWIQPDPEWIRAQQAAGRPLVRFADIPLEWTDFRLTLRQTADILLRFDVLDAGDHAGIVAHQDRDRRAHEFSEIWALIGSHMEIV